MRVNRHFSHAILRFVRSYDLAPMLFLSLGVSTVVMADQVVISDDGRQIRLNGDGTWVQLSKDRYATDAEGNRVRLKPDGSWTIVSSDQSQVRRAPGTTSALPALSESTLFLAKVEILKRKIKRAKSVHAQTSTIYHVQILNDSAEIIELDETLAAKLSAGSSSGGKYEVESVTFTPEQIQPGERGTVRVVATGSPQWFGVKFLSLSVAANAMGNSQPRVLSKNMSDVIKRNVDTL